MNIQKTISAIAAACMVCGVALAQTRPAMPPDPYDPANIENSSRSLGISNNDYPAQEVRAIPAAKARQVITRAEFERARNTLHLVVDTIKEDFEYSKEFLNAIGDEKSAYDAFAAERNRVLMSVTSNTEHRALLRLHRDLAERMESLRGRDANDNRAEILAIAQLKLSYAMKMSDMEADALDQDSSFKSARSKLIASGTKANEMRERFNRSIKRNPQFVDARRSMDDSRIAFLAADAYLGAALEARTIALEYAAFVHRYDNIRYAHPIYDNSYYGYGNTYPISTYNPGQYGRYRY